MAKLTILRGISGSGKSTWARQQNAVLVSRDSLRVAYFGDDSQDYYRVDKDVLRNREDFITKAEHAAIKSALVAGMDVISDNTHIQTKYLKPVIKIAQGVGAEIEVKEFNIPLAVALAQNKRRALTGGRDVPEDVIRKQHQSFQGSKGFVVPDAPVVKEYTGTPGKPKAFLYDLDGTTYHMSDKRRPYDHNVDVDDPDPVVQDIVRSMAHFYVPVAMSGRVEATRAKTELSLNRDNVPFDHLFMRDNGDFRPDNIVKAELFDKYVRDNFDVQFILDDRQQVVDAWRSMGIKTLQVEPGDF